MNRLSESFLIFRTKKIFTHYFFGSENFAKKVTVCKFETYKHYNA